MKKDVKISDFAGQHVWSYTRVSSKEQFLKNGSIETQVRKIKDFANEYKLRITGEFDAEFESSKRINTQKSLKKLIETIRNTPKKQRPKIILIWSPSRFGRAGAEHIELFVSLRRKYGVFLYAISSDHNTFTERNENEFSLQLLNAQKENFNRQDVVIPGMMNALENGKYLGRAPRGYDHYGPRVTDPSKVQAAQEIKLNKDGLLIRRAFKLKLYKGYTDKEILKFLSDNGLNIPKQTLSTMWRNSFYAGYFKNELLPDQEFKGHWEPIISKKDFKKLQIKLTQSSQNGTLKIRGKMETPLVPRFLKCAECQFNMTSYLNKNKGIYYYKCGKCNKTVNANTRLLSRKTGVHEQFSEYLNSLKISKPFIELFSLQLKKYLSNETENYSSKKRLIKIEINELQQKFDKMEERFAIGDISLEIFEKHGSKIKSQIDEKLKKIENLPSKMSNHEKILKKFSEISENPSKYYNKLDYHQKRKFQSIVFPEGMQFSTKNKQCLTSKMNLLFELTNSFSELYNPNKKRTQMRKALESNLVAGTGLEPVTFGL